MHRMTARFWTPRFDLDTSSKVALAVALGLSAAAIGMSSVSDASAQGVRFGAGVYYNEPDFLISPRSVVDRLQDRGFTEITRPRFDGDAYIIDATNPSGLRTRLFVDARDGGIIGRQRLDVPYYPAARPARPTPGYGWTEDDMRPRRVARAPDGLIPPADIPGAAPRAPRFEIPSEGSPPSRQGAERGPSGLNPDGRTVANPRRTAKLNPPQKPALPGVSPASPAPGLGKAGEGKPPAVPAAETAKVESPKPEPVTPAAIQPNPAEKPAAGTAKRDPSWKDPPSDEAKRKVRVIDGATVVPGTGDNAPPSAN